MVDELAEYPVADGCQGDREVRGQPLPGCQALHQSFYLRLFYNTLVWSFVVLFLGRVRVRLVHEQLKPCSLCFGECTLHLL